MKVLAFDTSTAQGSVAVVDGEQLLSERVWKRSQSHSELLTAEIENALRESRLSAKDIDALAAGQGPGSFTGIRVTINAARALGYALQKPIATFTTAEGLVHPITRTDLPVLTVINAQKNSFFVARFENMSKTETALWRQTDDLQFCSLEDLNTRLKSPHLCVGDGCDLSAPDLSPEAKSNFVRDAAISDFPLATSLATLTVSLANKSRLTVWNLAQPLYIRASGAEEKLREGTKT